MAKPKSIDDYLARVTGAQRSALLKLRNDVRSLLPDAEECISYSMPAFRHEGHVVAGFLATSRGCSYFPFSGTTLSTLSSELRRFSQTKSALHFDPLRPLPVTLVKKLLRARIAEIAERAPKATATKKRNAASTRTKAAKAAKAASPRPRARTKR